MYDWWVLQLAKLSVSRKLMVGFGVLLALLLLVVISSNRTLTHQTALSEQLAEVASLMEQAQQAEQGRLVFEAGSDPRQAEQVRQTLSGMLQRLQSCATASLTRPPWPTRPKPSKPTARPSTTSPQPISNAAPPVVCWWALHSRRWTASPASRN